MRILFIILGVTAMGLIVGLTPLQPPTPTFVNCTPVAPLLPLEYHSCVTTTPRATSTTTPLPTSTLLPLYTPTQESFETPQPQRNAYKVVKAAVNIRVGSSVQSPIVTTVRQNWQVELTNNARVYGDGYEWAQVTAYWDGKTLSKGLPKWVDVTGWIAVGRWNEFQIIDVYLTRVP